MAGLYMQKRFGAWQVGDNSDKGAVQFKLFFPGREKDPNQYESRSDVISIDCRQFLKRVVQ